MVRLGRLSATDAVGSSIGWAAQSRECGQQGKHLAAAARLAHLLPLLEAGAPRHILCQGLAGDGQAAAVHQVALVQVLQDGRGAAHLQGGTQRGVVCGVLLWSSSIAAAAEPSRACCLLPPSLFYSLLFYSWLAPPCRPPGPHLVHILHDVLPRGLEVCDERHAVADALEVVQGEGQAAGVRHGDQVQHCRGR